jgi:fucose permease
MGDERTATRRLNFSQAFNPMGSIFGMFVASMFILYNLDPTSEDSRRLMRDVENGKPAHSQLVAQQQEAATDLAKQLANPDLLRKRRLLMKAKNQAETTAATLAVVADPRPELARELTRKLAAQPSGSKFAESAAAVAVVFQLREPEPPTPAEAERDAAFGGAAGLELANLLATEIDALGANGALTAARPELAAAAAAARQTADALAKAFADRSNAANQVAAASQSVAGLASALQAAGDKLKPLGPESIKNYSAKTSEKFADIRAKDLGVVVLPYALMGFFLLGILGLFAWKLPRTSAHETSGELHFAATISRLVRNWRYLGGVIAQTFYVGAQIMCWTTIIQYAEGELGIPKSVAQNCNIVAMVIFVTSRFICTFLLHYIRPGALLALLAVGGLALTLGTIFIQGYAGLYCLVGVSACMSLMFPTIYGIALDGLGDDAKLGSAGLILAIGGGCLMPQIQGMILDLPPVNLGFVELSSVRASFFLPALCFVVIAVYGLTVLGKKAAIHKLAPAT